MDSGSINLYFPKHTVFLLHLRHFFVTFTRGRHVVQGCAYFKTNIKRVIDENDRVNPFNFKTEKKVQMINWPCLTVLIAFDYLSLNYPSS